MCIRDRIGTPYRGGGETKRGTDCSGMTCQIYKKVYHTKLQRSTDGQKKESSKVARRNLREGDLVFFSSRKSRRKVAHVGIYLKDGKFVHASTSQGVIVSSLNEPYYRTHWICLLYTSLAKLLTVFVSFISSSRKCGSMRPATQAHQSGNGGR